MRGSHEVGEGSISLLSDILGREQSALLIDGIVARLCVGIIMSELGGVGVGGETALRWLG